MSKQLSGRSAGYAYVTICMGRHKRVPGALVLGFSLRRSGTKWPIVCLVCPDVVGDKNAMWALRAVYDRVIPIDWIVHEALLPFGNMRALYGGFSQYLFTYLRILDPKTYGEKVPGKVFFLEDDILVLSRLDAAFELATPAGVFTNMSSVKYTTKRDGIPDRYGNVAHGTVVPHADIERSIREGGYVATANTMIMSPSAESFGAAMGILADPAPYGYRTCFSHPCEIIFAETFRGDWTAIGPAYTVFAGKYNVIEPRFGTTKAIHYYKEKPWLRANDWGMTADWDDEIEWWKAADGLRAYLGDKDWSPPWRSARNGIPFPEFDLEKYKREFGAGNEVTTLRCFDEYGKYRKGERYYSFPLRMELLVVGVEQIADVKKLPYWKRLTSGQQKDLARAPAVERITLRMVDQKRGGIS
jgi:hypothetical protein